MSRPVARDQSRPLTSTTCGRERLSAAGGVGARSWLDIQKHSRPGSLHLTHGASMEPGQCDSAEFRRPSGALHVKAVQACRPARAEAASQRRRSCGEGRCSPWARHTGVGFRQQAPREEVRGPTKPSIRPARRLGPQDQHLAILLGCRETANGHVTPDCIPDQTAASRQADHPARAVAVEREVSKNRCMKPHLTAWTDSAFLRLLGFRTRVLEILTLPLESVPHSRVTN